MTQAELTKLIRPLRETIERSLSWEGAYAAPAPVQVGPLTLTATVVTRRGVRSPYAIWYRASLEGRTVIEVDRQPEFVRLVARKLQEVK